MVMPLAAGKDVLHAHQGDAEEPIAPDQAAIVADHARAVRVTAPAGSGKTRTMVEWAIDRAARLDRTGDRSVLAVSFTNRAAADLQIRIAAGLTRAGLSVDLVRVSTFHSLASQTIGEFGHHLGLPARMRLIGEADATALIETVLTDHEFEYMDASTIGTAIKGILQLAGTLSDHHLPVEDAITWHEQQLAEYDRHLSEIADFKRKGDRKGCEAARLVTAERLDLLRVVPAFRELKRERGVFDYGDLMTYATDLAAIPEVGSELRRRHPHLIVDEYQDTNVVQRKLVRHLWDAEVSQLVVVGDDAQAIYRFRGATLDNFDRFADHFPGAGTAGLTRVYRHGAEVVRVAEAVAQHGSGWRPRTTEPQRGPSDVRAIEFPDQAAEAKWIAEHIASLAADDPRDVCVLAPQRRFLLPILKELEARGIPAEAPGLRGLLDSPTFHTVHALLQVAHDPGRSVAVARLLRSPKYRLGPHDIVSFVERAQQIASTERRDAGLEWHEDAGVRLLDGLLDTTRSVSGEVRERIEEFLDDVRRWVRLARTLPLAEFVEEAVTDLGLMDALATASGPLAVRAHAELEAAIEDARSYESVAPGAGLGGYLDHLDRLLTEDEDIEVASPDPSARAVRLLTVHSAKGLQFNHLVVTGVVEKIFPNEGTKGTNEATASGRAAIPLSLRDDVQRPSPRLWDPDDLAAHEGYLKEQSSDESRRLFYVACTRARESLVLTRAHWIWTNTGTPMRGACGSPYFAELEAAGIGIERIGGDPPDDNPLEDFVLFDPPPVADASTLERALAGDGDLDAEVAASGAQGSAVESVRELAQRLVDADLPPVAPAPPVEHTVTDLVMAMRCPVAYAQRKVLGLPQPVSAAARRGSAVHRWIEERGWALQEGGDPQAIPRPWHDEPVPSKRSRRAEKVVVDDDKGAESTEDDPPDPVETDDDADACANAWLRTPYASTTPVATELPVVLTIGGRYIRGTVDAVYEHDDGTLEIVDIKTGPAPDDEPGWLQLEAYGLAVAGERPPETVKLTFVSLTGAEPKVASRTWRGPMVTDNLREAIERIGGPYGCPGCKHCGSP